MLQRFNRYGILINPAKCVFGVEELQFFRTPRHFRWCVHITAASTNDKGLSQANYSLKADGIFRLSQLLSLIYPTLHHHLDPAQLNGSVYGAQQP